MQKRVLLVDPDPVFAERAVQAFTEAGVLLEAVAEERALDRTQGLQPDLVVLSERPEGNVFALCNRLRRNGPKGAAVAILAAYPDSDAVEAHRSSPTAADLYLPRPAEPDELLAALGPRLGLEIAAIDDDEILELDADELTEVDADPEMPRVPPGEERLAREELERTVVALQHELGEERERATALEAKLAEAEARAKSLSEVLDDSLAEREESDRGWTARLAEAEAAGAAARDEADAASRDAAGARGEAEAARRETAEARAETEAVRAEAEAAKIEAIEARAEADAAGAELGELRAELAAALARADDATAALVAAPPTDTGLSIEPEAGSPDVEALARELAEARADRERVQDELAAELAKLAHELAARDGELSAARRRNAQLENVVRTLETERARAPNGASDPAAELERLRAELEDLRGENVFLGTEVDRYAARLREAQRGNPG